MPDANAPQHDVVVIGSGAAGVSAAIPLVDAGLRVLMVDGGQTPRVEVPAGEYLELRRQDPRQWDWMVGRDYHALRNARHCRPNFAPPRSNTFFAITPMAIASRGDGFATIGSLAEAGYQCMGLRRRAVLRTRS